MGDYLDFLWNFRCLTIPKNMPAVFQKSSGIKKIYGWGGECTTVPKNFVEEHSVLCSRKSSVTK